MTLPRLLPVPPQPTSRPGLPATFQAPVSVATIQELAAISNLNANVTAAVSSLGYAFTAGAVYRCGTITFSTNAVIAVGTGLFAVSFQHPFRGTPVVLCGGGDNCVASLLAAIVSPTGFSVFNATAIANAANQKMQWIAIGV